MNKKLIKHRNSWALIIDKPLLEVLNIEGGAEIEISIEGESLIIRPQKKLVRQQPLNDDDVKKIAREIMDEYAPVFEKLSKT